MEPIQASHFGGTFGQLLLWNLYAVFYTRCLSFLSTIMQKVKNDQKLKSRVGSCVNVTRLDLNLWNLFTERAKTTHDFSETLLREIDVTDKKSLFVYGVFFFTKHTQVHPHEHPVTQSGLPLLKAGLWYCPHCYLLKTNLITGARKQLFGRFCSFSQSSPHLEETKIKLAKNRIILATQSRPIDTRRYTARLKVKAKMNNKIWY